MHSRSTIVRKPVKVLHSSPLLKVLVVFTLQFIMANLPFAELIIKSIFLLLRHGNFFFNFFSLFLGGELTEENGARFSFSNRNTGIAF